MKSGTAIILTAILLLFIGFAVWMSHSVSHDTYFWLTLIATILLTCISVHFMVNAIIQVLKGNQGYLAIAGKLTTSIVLTFICYLYVSASIHLRPAKQVDCSFDLNLFEQEIKIAFQADSVFVYSQVLQEEPYFPQIRRPVIIIDNAKKFVADPKQLQQYRAPCLGPDPNIAALRNEVSPFAQTFLGHCDMKGFEEVEFVFAHFDIKHGYYWDDFTFHFKPENE